MSHSRKKILLHLLKIICLGFLLAFLAIPLLAEDQTPKPQSPPAATAPKPAPKPKLAPRARECKTDEKSQKMEMPEEALQQKKVTGKIGGQEIRAKEGEEDK